MAHEIKTKVFNKYDKLIVVLYAISSLILGILVLFDPDNQLHFDIIAHFLGGATLAVLFLSFLKIPTKKSFYLAGLVFVAWEFFEISLIFIGLNIGGAFGGYLIKVGYEPLWNRIQDIFIDWLGFFVYFRYFSPQTFSTSKTPS